MVPAVETMTERELLMELVNEKRRQEKIRYIKWGISAVIIVLVVVLLIVYLPPVVKTIKKVDNAVDMMQSEIDNIKGSFDEAMEKLSGFEAIAEEFSDFDDLKEKLAGLEEIGEKLGEIDFDAFNNVITSFENLVNKIPWLFK